MEQKEVNIHDCREYIKYAPFYHTHKLRYSDGCDFSETIIIYGLDAIMNAEIYFYKEKIKLRSALDLSLYYAFDTAIIEKKEGKLCITLSRLDNNTFQVEQYGESFIDYVKEYRRNWYEAIVANGFDEDFAQKWVYEQAYRK